MLAYIVKYKIAQIKLIQYRILITNVEVNDPCNDWAMVAIKYHVLAVL